MKGWEKKRRWWEERWWVGLVHVEEVDWLMKIKDDQS